MNTCALLYCAQNEFEPWYLSRRTATQWYDVRYRGYGKNKIQQVGYTDTHPSKNISRGKSCKASF